MNPGLATTGRQKVWGTFDASRERLFRQFRDVTFDHRTGVPLHELERRVAEYLKTHADQPRVLQKANVFRIVVTQGQIGIDPADWFVDKLDHGGYVERPLYGDEQSLVRLVSVGWLDEATRGPLAAESTWLDKAYRLGLASGPVGGLDRGHISPGWDTLLSQGLNGLLRRVAVARNALGDRATHDQLAFYEAVEVVCRAVIELAGRFARLAEQMIGEYPEHAERLRIIASACSNVPANPPRSFHEALQSVWLMHEMIEMEGELVRSMGQFDRTLYPYYRADIESGRLTREQAKELVKFFWFKWYARTQGRVNGKNFCFGGQYPDGSEITNDLTYLALEAYEEMNTPDPKLSVRFLPGTDDRLYRRVAELVRQGHNAFVLMNDVPAVEALVKRGKAVEDARCYLPIGCYEPAVEGKEVGCTMNMTVNLAKPVELALHDGIDPLSGERLGLPTGDAREFRDFEHLWDAYRRQMDLFLLRSMECIRAAEREWPRINPSPLIAATIDDCISRGRDIGQGGAHYNSVGYVGAGIANAADSLLAVKKTVFDEKRFSMSELLDALRADFQGYERMRQYLLNRVPKWGNNNLEADAMVKRIADYYCGRVHEMSTFRGGLCQAALFSLDYAWKGGRQTGALPDGRRALEPLAPGVGASYGRDKSGVTALMNSVTKLDATLVPNGSVLDITLHPTAVSGDDGLDAFVNLIKTFFSKGGYALQFNVFDVATLRDAQRHPERYASLQVRVTGWSVYFTTLTKYEQDQFIMRNAHVG